MVFNSLDFGLFFLICFGVYWALPHRAQNRWLLVASYVFYAAWDWRFLGLILLSTAVDYLVGLRLAITESPKGRRALMVTSLVVNLGILGTFKYAGFFSDSLVALLAPLGIHLRPVLTDLVLPVGISFYTFQTLSYTIDIYRGRLEPTRNFLDFALFVAFFPQLVAGPIERARHLLPQITGRRRFVWEELGSGAWLVLWGIFKKAVIADNLARLVDGVYAPGALPTSAEVLVATYAFAVQIYCDFSGYTDVARGAARLLGFDLMLNFNLPYLSSNPAEFWRRWHISLSTWLRDYLYISLGGNRGGRVRTYRNLFLTMLLGGLWHGAAWTFVLWGAFHGILLMIHRLLRPRLEGVARGSGVWRVATAVVTFHLVCFGWLIFRAESFPHVVALLGTLAGPLELGLVPAWWLPLLVLVLPLVLVEATQAWSGDLEDIVSRSLFVRAPVYAALLLMILTLGEDFGQPFIYFQF